MESNSNVGIVCYQISLEKKPLSAKNRRRKRRIQEIGNECHALPTSDIAALVIYRDTHGEHKYL
jgi:hypothetical protein